MITPYRTIYWSVLRSVIAAAVGLALSAAMGCTAPNPAYRWEDRPRGDSNTPTGLPDAGRTGEVGRSPDGASGQGGTSGSSVCGTARPDLTDLVSVDSLAIDRAGNIYFSTDNGTNARIGKLPPMNAAANRDWLVLPVGGPLRGMAIDSARSTLYYTVGSARELQAVDLDAASPRPRTVARGLSDPNDLAVGPDGKVYLSDQGDGFVYSFTSTGQKTQVTTMGTIGETDNSIGPAGIAFASDGKLVVGAAGTDPLVRVTIGADGREAGRMAFGALRGWANGLAFDERGRLYVALFDLNQGRDVVRVDSDTASPVPFVRDGHFSSIVFGRGALDCRDLYAADPMGAVVRRMTTDANGLALP